jgi:hypothetical protein
MMSQPKLTEGHEEREAPDEMKQGLAMSLDIALMELRSIDLILERRPALAGVKDRFSKIEHAIAAAGRLDGLLRRYGTHRDGCLAKPDCTCGWEQVEAELRKVTL